jgi:hypothetical protein
MARRERQDSEPPPDRERDPEGRRSRLESVIPDLIKKAVQGGYDRATGGAETLRSFISDSKLPKEIANALFQQIDDTKNGLFRVVAKEIRGFLEAVDFQRELQKLLTTVSFEIKTEIRFIPNDTMPERVGRPQVKSKMKMKRQRGEKGSEEQEREETPPAATTETHQEVVPPPADESKIDDEGGRPSRPSNGDKPAEPTDKRDDEDFP